MTSSQANPAFSSTTVDATPANPITAPESTPQEKLSFAERHKAPTTKDVESNRWVFGAQQAAGDGGSGASVTRDTTRDSYAGDVTAAGTGMEGDRYTGNGTAVGAGTGTYQNDTMRNDTMPDNTYTSTGRDDNYVAGDGSMGNTAGSGVIGGAATGYDGTRRVGDDGTLGGPGSGTTYVAGNGYEGTGTGTGTGTRDDGVMEEGEGEHKKKNSLKKVIHALGNV